MTVAKLPVNEGRVQ